MHDDRVSVKFGCSVLIGMVLALVSNETILAQAPWQFSPPSEYESVAGAPLKLEEPVRDASDFVEERREDPPRRARKSPPVPSISEQFTFTSTRQPAGERFELDSEPFPPGSIQGYPAQYPLGAQQDYQQAPGALGYAPFLSPAQAYENLIQYAEVPGIGIRPYADYAPPGYYPRDYQTGPGTPLYERIQPPMAVTPEEFGRAVLRGPIRGSYLVPGTGTAFRFSGFVRMGANLDLDSVGTPDLFLPRAIAVPNEPSQNINYSARPTRISLDTWTPTELNNWMVHTFIQFDFLSGNPPAAGSSSNPRIRFAFVDFGYFRVGQDTTVFMDSSSFPRTADFQGPNGIVNSRQGLARITLPLTERIYWAAAAEHPFTDITTGGLGDNVQDVPDFTSHLRYEADRFHAQVAGIVRTIGYRPDDDLVTRRGGWGLNFTSNFHPWAILMDTNPLRDDYPGALTRSRVLMQYAFGRGIGRYIQDSSGIGLDAAVNSTGGFETLSAQGWTLAYEQWLSQSWLANFAYSNAKIGSTDALPNDTFAASQYLATTLWWIPVTNMSLGAEYLWGERENLDGQRANASRIQTVLQYNF
jgi:hypothetical protein